MVYIVEYEFSDDHGGGMFGPYVFDDYDKSLSFFLKAIKDKEDEIKWKKSRHCYAASLFSVDYRNGTSKEILKYSLF